MVFHVDKTKSHVVLTILSPNTLVFEYYWKFATKVANSRVDFNAMYFLHTNHSLFLYYTI